MKEIFLVLIILFSFGRSTTAQFLKQKIPSTYLNGNYSFYYNIYGQIIKITENQNLGSRYFVKFDDFFEIEIKLDEDDVNPYDIGVELGYLARILAAEAMTAHVDNNSKKISTFTQICIAETIKNRVKSQVGFFSYYKTYKDVVLKTGYAINRIEFRETRKWLKNAYSHKRFLEEILPVSIFVFFNNTDFTKGAIGFYTPAKSDPEKIKILQQYKTISIEGIDPTYEFVFWRF